MQLKTGNLFETKCGIIAHGVNCRNGFGSGVAGQIARLFPLAKEHYHLKYNHGGWKLGDVQFVFCPNRIIANCATQDNYGRSGVFVDYDAVATCLTKLFEYAESVNTGVAMPRIGCGLAGGNYEVVSNIIQQCQQGKNVYVEVWEL